MAANIEDVIGYLSKKAEHGIDPNVYKEMISSLQSGTAATAEALGQSGQQKFSRFGSPVVSAYKSKLDRSRLQSVGRNITSINIKKEEDKAQAMTDLGRLLMQKKQLEQQESQFDLGSLMSMLNPIAGAGAKGLYMLLNKDKAGQDSFSAGSAFETFKGIGG